MENSYFSSKKRSKSWLFRHLTVDCLEIRVYLHKRLKPISNFDKEKVFGTQSRQIFTIALAQSENLGVEVATAP